MTPFVLNFRDQMNGRGQLQAPAAFVDGQRDAVHTEWQGGWVLGEIKVDGIVAIR